MYVAAPGSFRLCATSPALLCSGPVLADGLGQAIPCSTPANQGILVNSVRFCVAPFRCAGGCRLPDSKRGAVAGSEVEEDVEAKSEEEETCSVFKEAADEASLSDVDSDCRGTSGPSLILAPLFALGDPQIRPSVRG
jgi:hypothetical protein